MNSIQDKINEEADRELKGKIRRVVWEFESKIGIDSGREIRIDSTYYTLRKLLNGIEESAFKARSGKARQNRTDEYHAALASVVQADREKG